MSRLDKITNPEVAAVFDGYPAAVRKKLMVLRHLVLETADELRVQGLEETLKWGRAELRREERQYDSNRLETIYAGSICDVLQLQHQIS